MPPATRTLTIKFDGSVKGLAAAAAKGRKEIDALEKRVDKFGMDGGARAGAGFLGNVTASLAKLPSVVSGAFSAAPPQAQAAIAAAGVAAAVMFASPLAGALVAAVSLALGGGVITAGILAASKDPAVKAAWSKVADTGRSALGELGKHFTGPMTRAAGVVEGVLTRLRPTLDRLGATFGPVVDRLVPAFAEMAERSLPAIAAAAIASVPLFDTLAQKAPVIGDAIGRFFKMVEDNGPTANLFFSRLLDAIVVAIDLTTWLVDKMAALFVKFDQAVVAVVTFGVKVSDAFGRIRSSASGMFDGLWNSFRTNANRIIQAWNRMEFRIGGGNIFGVSIPGFTLSTPDLPTFHRGGIVPGQGDQLIRARGGEGVFTAEQMRALGGLSGGGHVEVHVYLDGQEFRGMVRTEIRESNRALKRAVLAGGASVR